MPDGATHYKIWKRYIWVSGVVGVAAAALLQNPVIGIGVVAGYLAGRYITPDLDLVGVTSDEGRMMRELKVGGVLLVMIFIMYAYLMRFVGIGRKGHRNFFSHFPGVGTIIRIAWVLSLPAIFWIYFKQPLYPWIVSALIGIWAGLTLADTWHYIADVTHRKTRREYGGYLRSRKKDKSISRSRWRGH